MLPTRHSRRSSFHRGHFLNGWGTYFRRLIRPKQMDFEFALWLMLQLCLAPKRAYLHTSYHKETKNQWSRDDPAYVVLLSFFLLVSSSAYCLTFGHGFWSSVHTILYVLFVDFFLLSGVLSTACWLLANRTLKKQILPPHTAEQSVEWLYAFDVQCNAFFPLFLLLHVVQFIMSPLLLTRSFFSSVLATTLYVLAFSYYHYLNFLGYASLPFLERTEVFLYPIGLLLLSLPFAVLSRFNPAKFTIGLYFG